MTPDTIYVYLLSVTLPENYFAFVKLFLFTQNLGFQSLLPDKFKIEAPNQNLYPFVNCLVRQFRKHSYVP